MKNNTTLNTDKKQGFTLIELSIVLVIIGLIVGGVLVGQDLIKAAEVRATVSQFEKYNAAANTFRTKYNGLPGDLTSPTNYFTGITAATATTGCADGDGLITAVSACGTAITTGVVSGESMIFWAELAASNLIADNITTTRAFTFYAADASASTQTVLPNAKLGGGNLIGINSYKNYNYFVIEGITGAASNGVAATAKYLTPTQAYQIDTKLDDGTPTAGTVFSVGSGDLNKNANNGASGTTGATPGDSNGIATGSLTACWDSTLSVYNIATAANKAACQIGVRASF